MEPHEKVHVGDIVHYVDDNTGDTVGGMFPHRCYAALVTALDDMELVGLDGTSYSDNPIPNPWPPTTTRWYLSLTVFSPDGGTDVVRRATGPSPNGLKRWHHIKDCAVSHHVDWYPVGEREQQASESDVLSKE